RKGQYSSESIAPVRIFDIREVARAYAAIVMMRPDYSSRYPNRLTGDLLNEVFSSDALEDDYYISCYCLYRLKALISNKRFDGKYSKLRWHILTAASKYCGNNYKAWGFKNKNEALHNLFSMNDGEWFEKLESLVKIAIPDPDISRDLLKSQPLTSTILKSVDSVPK
ncbi:AIPR family protein, partial [Escherichia coli]